MPPPYRTPKDLVEALHAGGAGAREQLWQWVREPIARLMDRLITRHRLEHDRGLLILHALHAVEIHLRTRPPGEFEQLSQRAFRLAVLFQVGKLAANPFGRQPGPASGPAPLPECPDYHSQTFFLPAERIGAWWFGGDWFGGSIASDGSLWVMVADVTGHGYYAYLLASHLPLAWRHCWEALPAAGCQPTDMLAALHGLLEVCLPEGVYVEASLARLWPDGAATVAPAGGTRLLLRHGEQGQTALHTLTGAWLGLRRPDPGNQQSWTLAAGDELILASDGLVDQLTDYRGARDSLTALMARLGSSATLYDGVGQLLQEALRKYRQRDDITMVALRRREQR